VGLNRFVKTLSLLVIGLFLLGAGIDATLDRLNHSSQGNELAIYSDDGHLLAVFTGTLPQLAQADRADQLARTTHRVKVMTGETTYRWL
jgi:hypothetical protein